MGGEAGWEERRTPNGWPHAAVFMLRHRRDMDNPKVEGKESNKQINKQIIIVSNKCCKIIIIIREKKIARTIHFQIS